MPGPPSAGPPMNWCPKSVAEGPERVDGGPSHIVRKIASRGGELTSRHGCRPKTDVPRIEICQCRAVKASSMRRHPERRLRFVGSKEKTFTPTAFLVLCPADWNRH